MITTTHAWKCNIDYGSPRPTLLTGRGCTAPLAGQHNIMGKVCHRPLTCSCSTQETFSSVSYTLSRRQKARVHVAIHPLVSEQRHLKVFLAASIVIRDSMIRPLPHPCCIVSCGCTAEPACRTALMMSSLLLSAYARQMLDLCWERRRKYSALSHVS